MSKKDQDSLSNVITSGLLLAVGVITVSLLSIGIINKTAQTDGFEQVASAKAVLFSKDAVDLSDALTGEGQGQLFELQNIQPAAGGDNVIELYEDNQEYTIDIETIDGVPE